MTDEAGKAMGPSTIARQIRTAFDTNATSTGCSSSLPLANQKQKEGQRHRRALETVRGRFCRNHVLAGDRLSQSIMSEELLHPIALTRHGTLSGLAIWLVLLFASFKFAPARSFETSTYFEKCTYLFAIFVLLVVKTFVLALEMLVLDLSFSRAFCDELASSAWCIEIIALASHGIMATGPHPVLLDETTGARAQLIPLCEWISYCFIMSYTIENIELSWNPDSAASTLKLQSTFVAACVAISTATGMLTSFCSIYLSWYFILPTWVPFLFLLYRASRRIIWYQTLRSRQLRITHNDSLSSDDHDRLSCQEDSFNLARIAAILSVACTTACATQSVCFTVTLIAPRITAIADAVGKFQLLPICNLFIALWFQTLLNNAFKYSLDAFVTNKNSRLRLLRSFITKTWQTSSDVIIHATAHKECIQAVVSPAFLALIGTPPSESSTESTNARTVSSRKLNTSKLTRAGREKTIDQANLSLILDFFPQTENLRVCLVDLSESSHAEFEMNSLTGFNNNLTIGAGRNISERSAERNMKSLAQLVEKALTISDLTTSTLLCDLVECRHDAAIPNTIDSTSLDSLLHFKAKINVLLDGSKHVMLHQIMHRRKPSSDGLNPRYNTKDVDYNRHQQGTIRNNLLAAVEIVDHLRTAYKSEILVQSNHTSLPNDMAKSEALASRIPTKQNHPSGTATLSVECDTHAIDTTKFDQGKEIRRVSPIGNNFDELETTLKQTITSILDDTTAQDIISDIYEVKIEELDVISLMESITVDNKDRFQVKCIPKDFPLLLLDRQLIRHICRNTIANACQYGKRNGVIFIALSCYGSEGKSMFRMEIVNEPGLGHEKLLELDEVVVMAIFNQATQLSCTLHSQEFSFDFVSHGAKGNGSWIVKKSASLLGGVCG
jgi:hypothetical protein